MYMNFCSCVGIEDQCTAGFVCLAMCWIITHVHPHLPALLAGKACKSSFSYGRPVDCSTKKAPPLEPGFVSKTIYKDQMGSGWGVGASAVRSLQALHQGVSGSNASCLDLQTADVSTSQTMSAPSPCPALPCPALPCPALLCTWVISGMTCRISYFLSAAVVIALATSPSCSATP